MKIPEFQGFITVSIELLFKKFKFKNSPKKIIKDAI